MVVETVAELAHLVKNVAGVTVLVLPTAVVDNAGMMVAEETHVDHALMVSPAKMVFVSDLVSEPVEAESVVMTELEALADHAQWDKDAEVEFASATMTVTKETVDQQLLMQDLFVPLNPVDHAPLVSHAVPLDNVLPLLPVTLTSSLWTDSPMLPFQDNVHLVSVDPVLLILRMDSFGLLHQLPGMLQEVSVHTVSVLAVLDML